MKKRRRQKVVFYKNRRFLIYSLLGLFLFLGIGYSALGTDLSILGDTTIKEYYEPTLYNVLKKAAKEGTYAREYEGEHHDSFIEEPSKSIYYWYGSNDANGTAIKNKFNVIFADHCWWMIRTTDTGGVKMIYNGEAEDGKCLNIRGNHEGYGYATTTTSLDTTYYYGTSYTYDKTNNVFSLDGTITTGTINTGEYTCKQTTDNGTCATLYLVDTVSSGTTYSVISLNGNSHYSQFGTLAFNRSSNSPAYAGYMYNTVYPNKSESHMFGVANTQNNIGTGANYYYSDTIDYGNVTPNKYTLINPQPISSLSDYNDLVGKYVIYGTSGTNAYYVAKVSGTTINSRYLENGDLTISMMVGDTYTDNGNGTYTLNNPTAVSFIDWYNGSYSSYKNKYTCDGTNATCSNLKHISSSTSAGRYYYWGVEQAYKYSENVSFSNGTYTLTGDIKNIWDLDDSTNQGYLATHHYTCLSDSTTCSTVNYVNYYISDTLYYTQLTEVENVEAALVNMLSADNVNQINSRIKTGIDAWYKKYMTSYTEKLEDTIFCNDRSISSLGAWNPNGGGIISSSANNLQFKSYNTNNDLSCTNTTDKFSLANNKAKLTYPVGLMSKPEMNILNNNNVRKTGQSYWTVSPEDFDNYIAFSEYGGTGNQGFAQGSVFEVGVRPAISLKPGTEYAAGDGSMESPYYVGEVYNISSNSDLVPKISPPNYTVTLGNDNYAVTSFKVDGVLVTGDSFVMPNHDVVITDVQIVPAYYTITNTDSTINVPERGRVGRTIELTSSEWRVDSFKVNGTLVTGNSFVMPAENVTITDIQKIPSVTVESEHNPYANNINNVTYYENTFSGATSLTVELTYQTESTTYDWIYLYDVNGSSTPFNNKKYGGTTLKTETLTIPSNYLKIVFRTDVSNNNYYGFKAVITPNYS